MTAFDMIDRSDSDSDAGSAPPPRCALAPLTARQLRPGRGRCAWAVLAAQLAICSGGGADLARAADAGQLAPATQGERALAEGSIEGRVFMLRDGRREVFAWALVELRDARGSVVDARITARDGRYRFSGVRDDRYTVELGGGLRSLADALAVEVGPAQRRHLEFDLVSPMRFVARPSPPPMAALPPGPDAEPPPAAGPAELAAATAGPLSGGADAAVPADGPASPAAAAAPAGGRRALPLAADGRVVQLGAFGRRANAEQHLRAVTARGVLADSDTDIVTTAVGGRPLFRVLATPRSGSAEALCRALAARAVRCMLVGR